MTPTDEEIANFATLQRTGVLSEIVKLAGRLPVEWWGDAVALLELAERHNLPGKLEQCWDHDSRGRVNHVTHSPEWHRQRAKRTA